MERLAEHERRLVEQKQRLVQKGGLLFPITLRRLLMQMEEDNTTDIVSWISTEGSLFKIHKTDEFVKHILPLFFQQIKFETFQRQLNLWGFFKKSIQPNKGAYLHGQRLFLRDRPDLVYTLTRRRKRRPRGPHPSLVYAVTDAVTRQDTEETDTSTMEKVKAQQKQLHQQQQQPQQLLPSVVSAYPGTVPLPLAPPLLRASLCPQPPQPFRQVPSTLPHVVHHQDHHNYIDYNYDYNRVPPQSLFVLPPLLASPPPPPPPLVLQVAILPRAGSSVVYYHPHQFYHQHQHQHQHQYNPMYNSLKISTITTIEPTIRDD